MRLFRHIALAAAAAAFLVTATPARGAAGGIPAGPPRCKIDRVGSIAFGTYNPFAGAPLDGMGSIGYDCITTPGPIITLSAGSSGGFAARTMRQGGDILLYNVYADAARTRILGDGSAGTVTIDATNARKQTVPLHARVFAAQMVPRGNYSDALIITIDF